METAVVLAITEFAKAGMQFYASYMAQQGLTEEQINAAFEAARAEFKLNDPNNLPN